MKYFFVMDNNTKVQGSQIPPDQLHVPDFLDKIQYNNNDVTNTYIL